MNQIYVRESYKIKSNGQNSQTTLLDQLLHEYNSVNELNVISNLMCISLVGSQVCNGATNGAAVTEFHILMLVFSF